jgi:putative endonuclease
MPVWSDMPRIVDGSVRASRRRMHGIEKRIVYIIRSVADPSRHYVGITNDVDARLEWHNHGPSGYSVQFRPWSLVVAMHFPTERKAVRFERYLKSGSGRAFAKRHFAPARDASSNS